MALIFMEGFEYYRNRAFDWKANEFIVTEPEGASLSFMVPDLNQYPDHIRDEVGFLRRQSTEKRVAPLNERICLYAIGRILAMGIQP